MMPYVDAFGIRNVHVPKYIPAALRFWPARYGCGSRFWKDEKTNGTLFLCCHNDEATFPLYLLSVKSFIMPHLNIHVERQNANNTSPT
jgi:hypothetical protein